MSKQGQEYLATLPTQGPITPAVVQATAQGRAPWPNQRTPEGQALTAAVLQYEPGMNSQVQQQRQKAFNDFYGGGKSSEFVRSSRQAADHTLDLVDSLNGMTNLGFPAANAAKNFIGGQLGIETGANPAQTNVNALANELSGIWKKGGISDASIAEWANSIRLNGSRDQQQADVKKLVSLYDAGVAEIEKKRQDAFGPQASSLPPIISPELQGAMESVRRWAATGQFVDPRQKDQYGNPVSLSAMATGRLTPPSGQVVPQGGAQPQAPSNGGFSIRRIQ
jgi:hypothetical protein